MFGMASKATDNLRCRKTDLIDILSRDLDFIFNKMQEKRILTSRDYNNLRYTSGQAPGETATRLVDKVMGKGEGTCQTFLNLLKEDSITDNYPSLKDFFPSGPTSTLSPNGPIPALPTMCTDAPTQESGEFTQDGLYEMVNNPQGLCVIVNNEHFNTDKARRGTQKDVDALVDVFSSLRFKVLLCNDQTKQQIADVLPLFASLNLPELQKRGVLEWSDSDGQFADLKELPSHGDAFVCCILSHGKKGGVVGTDGEFLPTSEITSTFNGSVCPALINKPKVFIIQACQGSQAQGRVQADCSGGEDEMETDSPDPDTTAYYIPVESDFLIAFSTVENYLSFRVTTEGSWFIQSLCRHLHMGSNRGQDILSIFTQVNDDVSRKEAPRKAKQMSEQRSSLRKKLVFRK